MRRTIHDIIIRHLETYYNPDPDFGPVALACADEILKTIQTPPVPETPASGHEWRIVWVHIGDSTRYGTFTINGEDDLSARAAAELFIERTENIHRSKFAISSCSMIRAVLTNGETDETFSAPEHD